MKPLRRYRHPGITTDIVKRIYDEAGIEFDHLTTAVHERRKLQGTTRETVEKIVRRMIHEEIVYRVEGRLYLSETGKATWEGSPLFCAGELLESGGKAEWISEVVGMENDG